MEEAKAKPTKENPFVSILFNIILPVAILNQLTKRLGEDGPTIALIVALALPIGYGLLDYVRRRHKNYISLLGVVNILFTGGLALMQLEGFWFAVKEAAFPLLIGIAVLVSAFTKNPFMRLMAYNENVLNVPLIEQRLQAQGRERDFQSHLRTSTYLFATSFFISSLLNFLLARYIFIDIDPGLSTLERSSMLNDQIAQMTWLSFVVIALPLMVFTMVVMWHLIHGIRKMTGLEFGEIFPSAT